MSMDLGGALMPGCESRLGRSHLPVPMRFAGYSVLDAHSFQEDGRACARNTGESFFFSLAEHSIGRCEGPNEEWFNNHPPTADSVKLQFSP